MNRVLVIGLDGASPHLVHRWQDRLPNLSRLMSTGCSGTLRSVLPPRSIPAWYCLATGMNPAKLGVFGFSQRLPGTYDYTFANLGFCRAPTFWQILSEHGVKTAIVHVPGTFPPHPIDGVMVSGWPAPLNKGNLVYTYPETLSRDIDLLLSKPFEFLSDKPMRVDNDSEVLEERLRVLEMHGDVAEWVLSEHDWQVGIVVLSPVDRASHQFWRHLDPDHPAHDAAVAQRMGDALRTVYEVSDAQVGRLLALLDERDTVFVISDHGFGPATRTFYLNEWLRQRGYLVLTHHRRVGWVSRRSKVIGQLAAPLFWLNRVSPEFRRLADPLKRRALTNLLRHDYVRSRNRGLVRLNHLPVDWERTRAYCPDEGCLYLNLRGRDPLGTVEPGHEAEALMGEIMDGLCGIVDPDTGRHIPVTLHRKEEIYSGPFLRDAPELLIEMDGYATEVMAELGSETLFVTASGRSGTHTLDGIVVANGPEIEADQELTANLVDIAPTLLHHVGVPVPQESDGEVLLRIYAENSQTKHRPIAWTRIQLRGRDDEPENVYTEEELEEVEKQLRQLGYLG
jgi:predicted AlkP superfamily phosphohydrolase/phosphomutase